MEEKCIIFGNGAKQIEILNKLKSGFKLSGCFVKSERHFIYYAIKCVGQNASFICTKITPRVKITGKEGQYSCAIKWKNGKTRTLYGTVPMDLFEIYANQGKSK